MKHWIFLLCLGIGSLGAQTYRHHHTELGPAYSLAELRRWLGQAYPLLPQTGSALRLTHDISSPGGRHLTFAQTYRGHPIQHAGLKVNLDHRGRIWSTLANLRRFAPPQEPAFSLDSTSLRARYGESLGAEQIDIQARWWLSANQLIPAYRLETHQPGPVPSYEIWVDARQGRELMRRDPNAYCHPVQADSSGEGRVFRPDPCTRAEVAYGEWFSDQGDAHTELFESLMDTVVLRGLTLRNDTFCLRGPYVAITDLRSFHLPPATSTDGRFMFDRSEAGFEDVMCYYHIDAMQRYVQALGFTNLQNRPIRVDPHGMGDSDQSSFVSSGDGGYLLFGDGGVDDAEDADVIIHEYGHALSEAAAPGTRVGRERRGLDEGIGDYLCAAYSYDLSRWRWYDLFNWDGQNEFWAGRSVNSSQMYPPRNTSIYTYGEIWASTLMRVRQEIGVEAMDRIFFQSLYSNFTEMTLLDAAQLLLDADSMLYQGSHAQQLGAGFCESNLGDAEACMAVGLGLPQVHLLDRPWELLPTAAGGWQLRWRGPLQPGETTIEGYDLHGRRLWTQKVANGGPCEVGLSGQPRGIYWLKLRTLGRTWTLKLSQQP